MAEIKKEIATKKKPTTKRKKKGATAKAHAHIHASFNNTIVNITDERGATITWASGGTAAFKGSRKSTPFATQTVAEKAAAAAKEAGIQKVDADIQDAVGRDRYCLVGLSRIGTLLSCL